MCLKATQSNASVIWGCVGAFVNGWTVHEKGFGIASIVPSLQISVKLYFDYSFEFDMHLCHLEVVWEFDMHCCHLEVESLLLY